VITTWGSSFNTSQVPRADGSSWHQAGQGGNSLLRWGTNGLAFTSGGITAPTIELISGSIVVR